jgi:hypothetical protein
MEALLLRSVQAAFAHCLPFCFSDSDQSVRSSCKSLMLSALQAVHKALATYAVADCIANSPSVRSQNTVCPVNCHCHFSWSHSVRLLSSIRKRTVCSIFMKVGTRVIHKKLLRMHDFRENLSTDSHCLLTTEQ